MLTPCQVPAAYGRRLGSMATLACTASCCAAQYALGTYAQHKLRSNSSSKYLNQQVTLLVYVWTWQQGLGVTCEVAPLLQWVLQMAV